MREKVVVLIPCLNEEKTIQKVISNIRAVLDSAVIYVYDNNSTDNTAIFDEQVGSFTE